MVVLQLLGMFIVTLRGGRRGVVNCLEAGRVSAAFD
jgi:hypothetical protein